VPSEAIAGDEKITPPVAFVSQESVGLENKDAKGIRKKPKRVFREIRARAGKGVIFGN
jgi:hypothetical protein